MCCNNDKMQSLNKLTMYLVFFSLETKRVSITDTLSHRFNKTSTCVQSWYDTVEPSYHKNANCTRSLLLSRPFLALIRLEQSYACFQRHHTNALQEKLVVLKLQTGVVVWNVASVMVQCLDALSFSRNAWPTNDCSHAHYQAVGSPASQESVVVVDFKATVKRILQGRT